MVYVVLPSAMRRDCRIQDRLIASIWLNCSESKNASLLGSPPFSAVGLLESLLRALEANILGNSAITHHIKLTQFTVSQLNWLRAKYPYWLELEEVMRTQVANQKNDPTQLRAHIEQLLTWCKHHRVISHLEYIRTIGSNQRRLIINETQDLLADLITLGHSESFLYAFARRYFLEHANPAVLDDPLQLGLIEAERLGSLGNYKVWFKICGNTHIPAGGKLLIGKKVHNDFVRIPPQEFASGETGVLVSVRAADYKAAIIAAQIIFRRHLNSLLVTKPIKRVSIETTEFWVQLDAGVEMMVPGANIRPYEAPPLLNGNTLWLAQSKSPEVVPVLEQALAWVASSRELDGAPRFIALWLALVSIFETEDIQRIAYILAHYRVLAEPFLLASWVTDYVERLLKFQRVDDDTLSVSEQLHLYEKREYRMAPLVALLRSNSESLGRIVNKDPFLRYRVEEFKSLLNANAREWRVKRLHRVLLHQLPWVRNVRHAIAHAKSASPTALSLANRHLIEDISIVFDQVAAAALGTSNTNVSAIHAETVDRFQHLMDSVLNEPCLSVHHTRQGFEHRTPTPRKPWKTETL